MTMIIIIICGCVYCFECDDLTGSRTSASLAMMVEWREERRGTERKKLIWFSNFFKPGGQNY